MPNARSRERVFRLVLFAILGLLVVTTLPAPAQDTPASAAIAGLKGFLDSIPPGREADYGFASREEIGRAYLGPPYEMVSILPRDLDSAAGGSDVLYSLDSFRFPVLVNGRMRALLTVARDGEDWKPADFGAAVLAASIDRIEDGLPPQGEGGRRLFLRLFQLKFDFVGYAQPGQTAVEGTFVPLPSALAAIGAGPDAVILYTFPETLKVLRAKFAALPVALKGDVKSGATRKGGIR